MLGKMLRRGKARKFNRERGWKYVGRTPRGTALPDWPVDLWSYDWVKISDEVSLHHPGDANPIIARCHFVVRDQKRHPFATVEMQDGSHIFFVPD